MFDVGDYGRQFAHVYDQLIPQWTFTPEMARWILAQVETKSPDVLEFGVGTGRVLLSLLAEQRARTPDAPAPSYSGVDSSDEMLSVLAARDVGGSVQGFLGDIRTFKNSHLADIVLCVCSTIGMSVEEGSEEAIFASAYSNLRAGGVFIVETPSPGAMHAVFGEKGPRSVFVPYPGDLSGLVSFGSIEDAILKVNQVWLSDGEATFRTESARLTSADALIEMAQQAGLSFAGQYSDLLGTDAPEYPIMNVLVFRKS